MKKDCLSLLKKRKGEDESVVMLLLAETKNYCFFKDCEYKTYHMVKIFELVYCDNDNVTYEELSEAIGMSESSIKKIIKNLEETTIEVIKRNEKYKKLLK